MQENITKSIHRLQEFITNKGITLNRLSIELGLSNSYFSKMIKNSGSIGSDILEKIIRMYPDLNVEWLLTGSGEMLKKDTIPTFSHQNTAGKECTAVLTPEYPQRGKISDKSVEKASNKRRPSRKGVYDRMEEKYIENEKYWESEYYISENDKFTILDNCLWSNLFEKKEIRTLYKLNIKDLSNKIAFLKREHKYTYDTLRNLLQAINNFKLASYAEKFKIPKPWKDYITETEKDWEEEYLKIEDKKLKAIFYIISYKYEIEGIRDNIMVTINLFKHASSFISHIQGMSFEENDNEN